MTQALRTRAGRRLPRCAYAGEAEEAEAEEAEEAEAEAEADEGATAGVEAGAERAHVDALLAYLDERMCVPRDMGGPAAAAVRALHRRRNGRTVAAPSVVRVNRF